MNGTMMQYPLTLGPMLDRAAALYPRVEVVSREPDNTTVRESYCALRHRALALAGGLQEAGLQRGDRVATLMWNHGIHLEAYFGIPLAGGVIHTLNLRLHPDELSYIINHAEDRFLIIDNNLLPILKQVRSTKLERIFIVRHTGCDFSCENAEDYEALLATGGNFSVSSPDENEAAAMCYTSGTTGKPKAVVCSHRALVLHSLALGLVDGMALSNSDTVMPCSSMFHANAWGIPYAATMLGTKQVFPGPYLDAERVLDLLESERVTVSGGVPTVWLAVAQAIEDQPDRWKLQPGLRVIIAGSALPESLIRRFDRFGITAIQLWGMTETTPIATFCKLKPHLRNKPEDETYALRATQGIALPFVEIRACSDQRQVPWDGSTMGELQVRGPWVAGSYYNLAEENARWTDDGWLRTGDVVTIDDEGYVKITDRQKDLIKSGGEWISSVDLENAIVAHPSVKEAAVVAIPHPRWQERPLALVVRVEGRPVTPQDLRDLLLKKFAKWQLPDDFVFVNELPHTSTGKLLKTELRNFYAHWHQPGKANN
jgi:fatty-acyl-CoA synthase